MRKAGILVLGVLLATAMAGAQDTTQKKETKPIASLSWLVGGVWTADASKLGPGMQKIETRYVWSDNEAYLRFTTHFIFDKGTAKTYDGNLFWEPESKTLAIWYMDAQNGIIQGPMKWDGETLEVLFRAHDFDGKMADLKVDVAKKSDDLYHWSLSEKQGDSWKALADLDYRRVGKS